ncbi:MAG: hypothetical protein COB60_05900 [Flavobacteriaceae bacterium]|nr:MAG: hypothetical protein COB60_05900 [Flavobacteriaceae bacterium]
MKSSINKFTFLIFLLSAFFVQSQTKFEKASWDQVKEKAKEESKLIFVDLYFKGCAPCAQMDNEVFPNKEVSTILTNEFISFKSDIFKEDIGKKLSLKYAVGGFPTFLFLTADGQIVDITSGFHSVDEFTTLLSSVKDNANKNQYKKYSNNLDGDYPQFYSDAYLKGKRNVSFETIDAYLKTQNDLGSEVPFVIMSGLKVGGIYGDYIVENAEQLAEDYSRMQVRNNLLTVINRKGIILGKSNDQVAFNKVLEQCKPIFTEKEWTKFSPSFQEYFDENKIK